MEKIDIDAIIGRIQITPEFKQIFDKVILSGRRMIGSADTAPAIQKQLDKPGDFATNLAEGVVAIVFQLWTSSGKTLPPQIMGPVTFQLTLEAFDFLQKSNDDRTSKQVLGDAVDGALGMLLKGFNVDPAQIEQFVKQNKAALTAADAGPGSAQPPTQPPPAGGMIAQGGVQ